MSDFIFSNRTDWSLQNNPLSLAIEKFKEQNIEILDLTESNPTRCGFEYPLDLLKKLSDPSNLTYSPLAKGIFPAREAIAHYYAKRSLSIDPHRLVLTSSTSEGYSFLLKLLTNPGSHVLIPRPSYPLFQFILELHDVEFDYYPLMYDGNWQIDTDAFQGLVKRNTRAVIVVNPNNPTGSYVGKNDRNFLNEICLKNRMAIISDEVFLDYPINPSEPPQSLVSNDKVPTYVLSGLSKILALPQMKLSWIAINGPKEYIAPALDRLEIIADTYLSVNTPVQNAVSQWLSHSQFIQTQISKRVESNLQVLLQYDFNVLSVEAGWYVIIEDSSIESEEDLVLELLKEEHVLIHPGYFFDFEKEGYLVLSLLPKPEIFEQAIERIARKMKLK